MTAKPWRQAWQEASYGVDGYFQAGVIAQDFHTPAHDPLLWYWLLTRMRSLDVKQLHDLGAGDGTLIAGIASAAAAQNIRNAITLSGYDMRKPSPQWTTAVAAAAETSKQVECRWYQGDVALMRQPLPGLSCAVELLDDIPTEVAIARETGCADSARPACVSWHYLLVDRNGEETVGDVCTEADLSWLQLWWPHPVVGDRVEIGRTRDECALALARNCVAGELWLIDYGITPPTHSSSARAPWPGTLAGYSQGIQVAAIADGRRNLTAHVHFPAVAASLSALGQVHTWPLADVLGLPPAHPWQSFTALRFRPLAKVHEP